MRRRCSSNVEGLQRNMALQIQQELQAPAGVQGRRRHLLASARASSLLFADAFLAHLLVSPIPAGCGALGRVGGVCSSFGGVGGAEVLEVLEMLEVLMCWRC